MPRRLAILLIPCLLVTGAHAQDRQGSPPAQSQALTDAENALMAKVAEGDKAYDAAADAIDAGKDDDAICPSLADAVDGLRGQLADDGAGQDDDRRRTRHGRHPSRLGNRRRRRPQDRHQCQPRRGRRRAGHPQLPGIARTPTRGDSS
ncbi:MAG: hypothetical protein WDN06_05140 [Asticcacaulis sp.]